MWKKDEVPTQTPAPRPEATPQPTHTAPVVTKSADRATIGRSITIKGEVSGDEDLLIQGRVDGSVDLKQHSVTIGPEGEVKANISARVVTVEGRVEGNLSADEQIILRASAKVQGDMSSPRVVLEDGAQFRGGVDMSDAAERGRRTGGGAQQQQQQKRHEPQKPAERVEATRGASDSGAGVTP